MEKENSIIKQEGNSISTSVAHCAGYGRAIASEPRNDGREERGDTEDGYAIAFLKELSVLYPDFYFKKGPRFKFRPPKTIYVAYDDDNFALLTLHELGHALCKHKDYTTHIQRLKIESEAWEMAKTVLKKHPEWAKKYNLTYDEDFAESQLDTYRDWLHAKSKCQKCGLTRFQTPDKTYHCPRCDLLLHSPNT